MAVSNIILPEGTSDTQLLTLAVQQMDLNGNIGPTKFTQLSGAQGIAFSVVGAPVGMSFQLVAAFWNGAAWTLLPFAIAAQDRSTANPSGARLAAIVAPGNYWAGVSGLQALAFNFTAFTSGTARIISTTIPDQTQT